MRAHRVGIERDCLKMEKPLIVEIRGFLSFRCRNQRHPPDSVSFKNTVAITSNIGQTIIPVCKNYAISRRKKTRIWLGFGGFIPAQLVRTIPNRRIIHHSLPLSMSIFAFSFAAQDS